MIPRQFVSRLSSPWAQGAALYLICFAVLGALLFSTPGFLGTDDYYHARISAQIVAQGRLALDFPWLPRTILSPERFVDHHLLYHLALALPVHLAGIAGAKLVTAGIAAGVFVAVWALLRQIGARQPTLWTLAMFGLSVPFLYRMLMIRTQSAALLLLIVALIVLFRRQYRWLVPLGFAYTWLYDGFVLLLAVAALDAIGQWIAERKVAWQPVVYTATGIGLGLLVNPYFPQNIAFIVEHLGAKVGFESGVRVGNEWYPYETGTLLNNSLGALLAMATGVLRPSFGGRRRDRVETTLLLLALLTLFMVFKSRRFIEYFPAFALLFCAASWRETAVSLQPSAFSFSAPRTRKMAAALSPLVRTSFIVVILLLLAGNTLVGAWRDAQNATDVELFAGASAWLQENSPPGAVVFQTDWDDFPRLFYYNTYNTYLVGLDPTYLERADPALWDRWVEITRGQVAQPSTAIDAEFGAAYVVSDTQHAAFADRADDDPGLRLVYRDNATLVWEVLPTVAARLVHDDPDRSARYSD